MRFAARLQLEGAESFVKSWRELMSRIAEKSTALANVLTPKTNPLAGHAAPAASLVDIPRLITAYYSERPDPAIAAQQVAFGTSGHRGSSFESSFNRTSCALDQSSHLRVSPAAEHRRSAVHGLRHSRALGAAFASALEVLAANGVEVMVSAGNEYTPDAGRVARHPDLQPRPRDGSRRRHRHLRLRTTSGQRRFQVQPAERRTADTDVTKWIESRANDLLRSGAGAINRVGFAAAAACRHHPHSRLPGKLRG